MVAVLASPAMLPEEEDIGNSAGEVTVKMSENPALSFGCRGSFSFCEVSCTMGGGGFLGGGGDSFGAGATAGGRGLDGGGAGLAGGGAGRAGGAGLAGGGAGRPGGVGLGGGGFSATSLDSVIVISEITV